MKTILDGVRFSYLNVFEPKSINGSNPKYSVQIIIPKTNEEAVNRLNKAIELTKEEVKDKVFKGKLPQNLKTTIHDGDGLTPGGEEYPESCKGCWVFNASNNDRPFVKIQTGIGKMRDADESEIKSGDWGTVSLNLWGYDRSGNRGITTYLNGILKKRDGEPLGNVNRAEDDFKDVLNNDDFDAGNNIDPITGLPLDDAISF